METENEITFKNKGISVFSFIIASLLNIGGFFMPPPFKRWTDYNLNYGIPNRKLDESALISLRRRGIISLGEYFKELQYLGYNPDRAEKMYQLSERLADISDLVNLYWRKEIDLKTYQTRMESLGVSATLARELLKLREQRLDPETVIRAWRRQIKNIETNEDYFDDLRQQGWTEDRIDLLKKVTEYYPSPLDLIRFAVREVYTPDIVKKYGQLEDLPTKFLQEAKKAGLPEEQAKNYWASHWVLPTPTQGFEMLHRDVINYDELKTLLRTLDIMPYWRDKLIKIAYTPYTRVDVRRMNKLGVLDREGVKRAYLDLGYDDEKAEKMTEFTIRYNEEPTTQEQTEEDKRREELRGLTRSVIINRYKQGSINDTQAREWLRDIGLSDEVIDFYIAQADYEIEEEKEKSYITQYHRMFVNGVIDYNKTSDLLDDLQIPARQKEYLLDLWDLERIGKSSLPSKSEIIRFLKKGIIDIDKFKELLSNLGYSLEYINYYLKDAGLVSVE